MFDDEDHWGDREDDFNRKPVRQTAKGIGWVGILVVVVLVVFGGIGIGVWAFNVGTSDVKGIGDAERMKNDARNRINAQENFEQLYQGIVSADQKLNVTADALATKPDDLKLGTELIGQKHFCLGLVSEYNAKARSFSQQDFRAVDLPHEIDQSAEKTDCEETKK